MARYAAIDIGSNSVRMLAAEAAPGSQWKTLAADREVTRIGASVFEKGLISTEAIDSVSAVLRRMAMGYGSLKVDAVRAVATSAVRDASNQAEFIGRASTSLGSPVEIISGQEEARLIHLGVQSRWPQPEGQSLIIDVGGGSAEFIAGEGSELRAAFSRPLGAVRLTEVFLRHDPPEAKELNQLDQFIADKLDPVLKRLKETRFDRVIATSATAAAIVSAANGIDRSDRDAADRMKARTGQIRKLYAELSASDLQTRRKMKGVGPRRAEIVIAGVAVFLRTMELLNLDSLSYSTAGVRDGIIADLSARGVGQEPARLSREQLKVVEDLSRKYQVNLNYGRQVAAFASELFDSTQPVHKLPSEMGKLLHAAAYLHDTGHFISDTGHHKHSAYIVASSDLPGFTDNERRLIALLCRYHRKALPQSRHDPFRVLAADERRAVLMMIPLLRLAVALDASQQESVERIYYQGGPAGATLRIAGRGEIGLEIWAAERAADDFRQIYELPLAITRQKP